MDSNDTQRTSAAAWEDVAQQLRSLGVQLADRYRQQAPARESVDRSDVNDAVRRIADAAEQAVDSVGAAVKDPQFRDQAKRAAQAVVDAVGATVTQLGDNLRSYAPRYTPPRKPPEGYGEPSTGSERGRAEPPPDAEAVWAEPPPDAEAVWEEPQPDNPAG